jgi:hypothetical protein
LWHKEIDRNGAGKKNMEFRPDYGHTGDTVRENLENWHKIGAYINKLKYKR